MTEDAFAMHAMSSIDDQIWSQAMYVSNFSSLMDSRNYHTPVLWILFICSWML